MTARTAEADSSRQSKTVEGRLERSRSIARRLLLALLQDL